MQFLSVTEKSDNLYKQLCLVSRTCGAITQANLPIMKSFGPSQVTIVGRDTRTFFRRLKEDFQKWVIDEDALDLIDKLLVLDHKQVRLI